MRVPLRRPRRRGAAASTPSSATCCRSVCVDRTTIVSVRATPSMERTRLMSCSSVSVLRVFTLSSSVWTPVTWWHSSTSSSRSTCTSKAVISFGWLIDTPMKAVTSSPTRRASSTAW